MGHIARHDWVCNRLVSQIDLFNERDRVFNHRADLFNERDRVFNERLKIRWSSNSAIAYRVMDEN